MSRGTSVRNVASCRRVVQSDPTLMAFWYLRGNRGVSALQRLGWAAPGEQPSALHVAMSMLGTTQLIILHDGGPSVQQSGRLRR